MLDSNTLPCCTSTEVDLGEHKVSLTLNGQSWKGVGSIMVSPLPTGAHLLTSANSSYPSVRSLKRDTVSCPENDDDMEVIIGGQGFSQYPSSSFSCAFLGREDVAFVKSDSELVCKCPRSTRWSNSTLTGFGDNTAPNSSADIFLRSTYEDSTMNVWIAGFSTPLLSPIVSFFTPPSLQLVEPSFDFSKDGSVVAITGESVMIEIKSQEMRPQILPVHVVV